MCRYYLYTIVAIVRPVLAIVVAAAIGVLAPALAFSAEVGKVTHTYKKAGDLEIKADVYAYGDEESRPVVVWIHGGALINGHRESVPKWLADECRSSGYVLVSIDYRLAPETQLPEIIKDVEDAFAWIADQGPKLFHADPKRIGVVGGSAGGYLTLTAGYRAKPRPAVLVSLWGYGDLIGKWYSEPSPHPRHHQSKLSREEAYKQVSGQPISDSRNRKGDGGAFYQYCRQHGHWPKAVAGWDLHTEKEKFFPYMPLKNIAEEAYPPTMLIHGDQDTDVPHDQSIDMCFALNLGNIDYSLVSVRGGEHGLAGAKPEDVEDAYERAIAFLKRHLKEK